MTETADWNGTGEHDDDPKFLTWMNDLQETVIQGEYGYEPGEFDVCADHWRPLFDRGLTPSKAFRSALDDFAKQRRTAAN